MKLVIEDDAVNDADLIADFYDRAEYGTGAYFLSRMRETGLELLSTGIARSKRFGFFFCMVIRFPVAMYYRIDADIRICAVLDCRLDPRTIREILLCR
jgi:hypothetical protein